MQSLNSKKIEERIELYKQLFGDNSKNFTITEERALKMRANVKKIVREHQEAIMFDETASAKDVVSF